MTFQEYRKKYKLSINDIAEATGKPVRTVSYWHKSDFPVLTNGRELLAVFQPHKALWESEAYINKSKQLGVNQ